MHGGFYAEDEYDACRRVELLETNIRTNRLAVSFRAYYQDGSTRIYLDSERQPERTQEILEMYGLDKL